MPRQQGWSVFVAELVGTFLVVFIACAALVVNDYVSPGGLGFVGIALAYGLAVAVAVSAMLPVSGGHLNPAVTAAFLILRRIKGDMALLYFLAQLIGAVVAALLVTAALPAYNVAAVHAGVPVLGLHVGTGRGVLIEAILTFLVVLVQLTTASDPATARIAGFGVGLAVLLAVLVAGPFTGAAVNPARAFGPALVGGQWTAWWIWWLGPLAGGAAAALVYGGCLADRPQPEAAPAGAPLPQSAAVAPRRPRGRR